MTDEQNTPTTEPQAHPNAPTWALTGGGFGSAPDPTTEQEPDPE